MDALEAERHTQSNKQPDWRRVSPLAPWHIKHTSRKPRSWVCFPEHIINIKKSKSNYTSFFFQINWNMSWKKKKHNCISASAPHYHPPCNSRITGVGRKVATWNQGQSPGDKSSNHFTSAIWGPKWDGEMQRDSFTTLKGNQPPSFHNQLGSERPGLLVSKVHSIQITQGIQQMPQNQSRLTHWAFLALFSILSAFISITPKWRYR